MSATKAIDLLALAEALDTEAKKLQERAINARAQKSVVGSEANEWANNFATAYQTLRGIAAALRAMETSNGKGDNP